MTDKSCGYFDEREEMLVAYLYDDIDPGERTAFQAHLLTCVRCRDEVSALRRVRTRLARWAPPEPARLIAGWQAEQGGSHTLSRDGGGGRAWATLAAIPAWTQVAAALLCLGGAAGVANLDVRYGQNGLSVRTGWSKTRPALDPTPAAPPAPWRGEFEALEARIRTEVRAAQASLLARTAAAPAPRATPISDAEIARRVRPLLDESERRQQRELALRVADLIRELDTQRRADLMKIDRSLGVLQNNTGVEVMKQRELLNYLVRVSQKQ
jgi:hypothetical protein